MAFPVTAIITAAKWGAVLAVMTLALVTYRQMKEDERNMRDTLIQTNAEKISAQARSQELTNANVALEAALKITHESQRIADAAILELKRKNEIAQEEADHQRQVLADVSQLQLVATGRTKLLEKMVNRATKARFDELEGLFNSE